MKKKLAILSFLLTIVLSNAKSNLDIHDALNRMTYSAVFDDRQERKSYEGPFSLENGLIGKAKYQYYISGKDTIKHGTFNFHTDFIDSSNEEIYRSVSFEGSYNKGLKNDRWVISSKRVKPVGKFQENDYRIVYETEGQEFYVKAHFNSGVASGRWEIVEQNISNSLPTDTIKHIVADFEDGSMIGDIRGLFNGVRFTGEVSKSGFIDNRWVFKYPTYEGKRVEEQRIFENGLNTSHFIVFGKDSIMLEYIGIDKGVDEGELLENLVIDGKYFETIESANIDYKTSNLKIQETDLLKDTNQEIVIKTDKILESVFRSFSQKNNVLFWSLLSGSKPLNPVNVKLRKFPLTNEEKRKLDSTHKLINEVTHIFVEVFNNPNIEIGRLANKQLMFYYEVMKVYKAQFPQFAELAKQFSKPSFEFINREKVFKYIVEDVNYPDSIKYYYRDQFYTELYSFPKIATEGESGVFLIHQYFEKVFSDMIKVESEMDKIIDNKLSASKVNEKEKNLLLLKDSVLSLYTNKVNNELYNEYHEKIAVKVEAHISNTFENYAILELKEKSDTIDDILKCFESLVKLYDAQAKIPVKLSRLDEVYTRIVWNPFTMSDMEERMKSRVYNAFEKYLFPYYLSNVESFTNCADLEYKHQYFDLIYKRMIELREQDTKELEKALKGENSPERILQLFNIQLKGDNE